MRVLVVDDEPQIVRALALNLRARGFEPLTAATGAEALELAARNPPDLVLLDLGLPEIGQGRDRKAAGLDRVAVSAGR